MPHLRAENSYEERGERRYVSRGKGMGEHFRSVCVHHACASSESLQSFLDIVKEWSARSPQQSVWTKLESG